MKGSFLKTSFNAVGAAILAACAPVNLLNSITPSESFSKTKDIPYGDLDRQKLDIYKAKTRKTNAPIIVFVHGGGWDSGSKDTYKFLAEAFTSRGYDIAVPNYRLYPEARYPDMIVDTAKAIAYISRQYEDRSIVVMGHSAGGYNALMAVLNTSYLAQQGVSVCDRISGLISLAGPTGGYALTNELYITIFPDRFLGTDAPLAHISSPSPPLLMINGADDTTVGPKNASRLVEAVKARGGQATLKIYEDYGHITPIKNFSKHFDKSNAYKDDVFAFIEALPVQGNFCS